MNILKFSQKEKKENVWYKWRSTHFFFLYLFSLVELIKRSDN